MRITRLFSRALTSSTRPSAPATVSPAPEPERAVDTFEGLSVGDHVICELREAFVGVVEALGDRGSVKLRDDNWHRPERRSCTRTIDAFAGVKKGDLALHANAPKHLTFVYKVEAVGEDGRILWHVYEGYPRFQLQPLDTMYLCVPEHDGLRPGDRIVTNEGNFGEVLHLTAQGLVRIHYRDALSAKAYCMITDRDKLTRVDTERSRA